MKLYQLQFFFFSFLSFQSNFMPVTALECPENNSIAKH